MNRNEYTIVEALSPFYDGPVYHIEKTGTTMADAEQYISGQGLPGILPFEPVQSGTVLWADYQTKGMGRLLGRMWEGAWGESCLFTLILHEEHVPFPAGFFPLLAGLALQFLVERELGLHAGIKWPNDLLLEHEGVYKKVSGILCRKTGPWYTLGVGINCNQLNFDGALTEQAVSLRMAGGNKIEIGEFLFGILDACKRVFDVGVNDGWKQRLEQKMLFMHEKVLIIRGRPPEEEKIEAILSGIGLNGELLYKRSDESAVEHLYAGEISGLFGNSLSNTASELA